MSSHYNQDINGWIILDKPTDISSNQALRKIQYLLHAKKAGHIGTLDPFATGLLVVAINKGTKLLTYLNDGDKTYEATLLLGEKTSTGDLEGEVIEKKDVPNISKEKLDEVLRSFLGNSQQIPPKFSAIKVNGVPLYKSARQGKEVEVKPRDITIYSLEGTIDGTIIHLKAKVSKGTYIRTLCEDIGNSLGFGAYCEALRRLSCGSRAPHSLKKNLHRRSFG